MYRGALTGAAVLTAMLTVSVAAAETQATAGALLDATLQPYLTRFGLPALAAAVVKDGKVIASGVVGTRRLRAEIPVTINDKFHIGSDTKAMTSLLAGMMVESGKLRWNTTVGEVFPELAAIMNPDLKGVTLEQLLSHTSGIPSDTENDEKLILQSYAQDTLNLDEMRQWLIKQMAPQPLQSKPGEKFAYANMGYTLAGAIIERVSGTTWEELIIDRVFDPLGLKTAGLGPQSTLGRVDAPLGHAPQENGPPKPMLAGPNGDNPELIGPAGTAHMSVLDFATWGGWNAGQGARGPALVKPETLRKIHTKVIDMPPKPDAKPGTPSQGAYALGWVHVPLPFSTEPFLAHGGSNNKNLAQILLQPHHDFGMVLMTNLGGERADEALKALSEELYKRYGPAR
jgi:CubicO group peptidase (beta-lactamase class C family)